MGIGTSLRRSDFWDCLGGQAIVMIIIIGAFYILATCSSRLGYQILCLHRLVILAP